MTTTTTIPPWDELPIYTMHTWDGLTIAEREALDPAPPSPTYTDADGITTWVGNTPPLPPYAPTCALCARPNDGDNAGNGIVCFHCRHELMTTCGCGTVVWPGWDQYRMYPTNDQPSWVLARTLMGIVRNRVRSLLIAQGYQTHHGVCAPMHEARIQSIWAHPIWALHLHDSELNTGINTIDERLVCDDCVHYCPDCNEPWWDWDHAQECCPDFRCAECECAYTDEYEALRCCLPIHGYSYTPPLRYYTDDGELPHKHAITQGQLLMGIELECERAAPHMHDWYRDADEDAQAPRYMWAKHDGSLGHEGVEFVSMPGTIGAHRAMFPWDAMRKLRDNGARAFHMGTCGMHIHCARASFDAPHMWRFVQMQLRNQAMCERVAQRSDTQWAKWSPLRHDVHDGMLPDLVKGKHRNGERYVAINFQNDYTIELRYFRANLMPHAIHTRIEFVQALFDYTKPLTVHAVRDGALREAPFMRWLDAHADDYPYLNTYLNDEERN